MVLLRICSSKEEDLKEVAEFLLKNHLAIDINFKKDLTRLEYENGALIEKPICLLTAKTKGLLFTTIDENMRRMFAGREMPELYSIPIVHMDWNQAAHLVEDVKPA
jgi:uncharacterized protein involved in tolerance to divalent cations